MGGNIENVETDAIVIGVYFYAISMYSVFNFLKSQLECYRNVKLFPLSLRSCDTDFVQFIHTRQTCVDLHKTGNGYKVIHLINLIIYPAIIEKF